LRIGSAIIILRLLIRNSRLLVTEKILKVNDALVIIKHVGGLRTEQITVLDRSLRPLRVRVRRAAFLSETDVTESEFGILWIHVVVVAAVLAELILIIFNPPAKVRTPLVRFILFDASTSLTFEHGLIKSAGCDLIRLYLGLLHLLVNLYQLLGLFASSTRLE
jgi:hypothetical protein